MTDNFKDQNVLGPLGVDAAQFFANGVNTQTHGIDVVLNYDFRFNDDKLLKILAVGNFNDLKIKKINNGNLNEYTFFSPFSRAYLEAAAPDHKLGLGLNYIASKFNASLSLTRFSEVQLQDFQLVDDPPLTKADADTLYEKATDVYEARTFLIPL